MNYQNLHNLLPHRYPFLMIDRIISIEPNSKVHAIKNVTINESFFPGHFPDYPVMPGVLIIEALAQAGILLTFPSLSFNAETKQITHSETYPKINYLTGIKEASFRRLVLPGDRVDLHVDCLKSKMGFYEMRGVALVDGDVAVETIITAMIQKDKRNL